MSAQVRVALPGGDLRDPLAERLAAVGFVAEGYGEGSRAYRFAVSGRPEVLVRVFSERDIPIQVVVMCLPHLARPAGANALEQSISAEDGPDLDGQTVIGGISRASCHWWL